MKKFLPWILLAALAAFLAWKLHTSHFDWAGLLRSLRSADWRLVAAAVALIWFQNLLRAARWSIFLQPAYQQTGLRPTPWYRLIGSQFIGFTGLALFGRVGELIRPLLVSRRTGLSFSSQVAVVAVERVFDLGALAFIFSLNLLLSPGLQSLPYHGLFHKVGYVIAALTVFLTVFVAGVRLAGTAVANLMARLAGLVSPKLAVSVRDKILAFRDGLNVLRGPADLAGAIVLSLLLWINVSLCYLAVVKAFPAPVSQLTVPDTIILMGFSVVGSLVQLPGVGGGAQVATISALTALFSLPSDLAVSAGIMLWLVVTMAVIPAGLVYARVEGISLRQAARRTEAAAEAT